MSGEYTATFTGEQMTETRQEHMTAPPPEAANGRRGGFLKGLVGGALIGTAAGVLFAPRIHAALGTVRRQVTDAAVGAGDAVVDDLRQTGRGVYGKALSVVIRGAEDVRERATEAQAELEQRVARAHTGS